MSDHLLTFQRECTDKGWATHVSGTEPPHLYFAQPLDREMVVDYALALARSGLPTTLAFTIDSGLGGRNLDRLLPLCEQFLYCDDWFRVDPNEFEYRHYDFSQWARSSWCDFKCYPHVRTLMIPNLLSLAGSGKLRVDLDLQHFKLLFPNLKTLLYSTTPKQPALCTEADLARHYDAAVLSPML